VAALPFDFLVAQAKAIGTAVKDAGEIVGHHER
jgi:hypothetical protein